MIRLGKRPEGEGCRVGLPRVPMALMAMAVLCFGLAIAPLGTKPALAQSDRPTESTSPSEGNVPGGHLGTQSDSDLWRALNHGLQAEISGPNKNAGILIHRTGQDWRETRNVLMPKIGVWVVLGAVGICALFFLIRGRIKISAGPSGSVIERFNFLDRFAHWLTAGSFIILALTGMCLLYGKFLLMPIIGPDLFSTLMVGGKYAHNFLGFSFMVGLVLIFVLWVKDNFLNKWDLIWASQLGGFFAKDKHPPSRKFNLGQKVIFWSVILGGLSLSISGIALLFPFEFSFFADTFVILNAVGMSLPTDLSPIQEQQLSQLWHGLVSLILIAIVICHIYIGSLGMEGAFAAMGEGMVDENWARDHHSIWVAEVKGEPLPHVGDHGGSHGQQPAE